MDIFKSNIAVGVAAAIAATVLAPLLVPIITVAGRPLAKSLLKGGVILYEKGRETVAGAGEVMEDLIAEVRSEMERPPAGVAASPEEAGDQGIEEREAGVSPREAGAPSRYTGNGAQV